MRRSLPTLVFLAFALGCLLAQAARAGGYASGAPWPGARHDHLNSGRADDIRPSRISERDSTPLWAFRTGGPIYSAPVVGDDDTVYVGSADSVFYAIGPDGKLKWSCRTGRLIDSAAALSDDGRVYVPSGDGHVYALDAGTGRQIWRFASRNVKPDRVEMVGWFEGSVSLSPDGLILAPCDDFHVYGIGADGTLRFDSATKGMVWSVIPTDDQGRHYFGSLDFSCYAIDAGGSILWRTPTMGVVSCPVALGRRNSVYITSFDGKVYCLDSETGKPRWSFKTSDHVYGGVAVGADGTLYVGSADGALYALEDKGSAVQLKWKYETLGAVRGSPAVDGDGNVYFANGNGEVFVLSARGQRRWSINLTECDSNDINANIALGRRGFYVAMQDGRVIRVPYEYGLRRGLTAGKGVTVGPGEEMPDHGCHLYWVTPGGNFLPTDGELDEVPVSNPITLRLLVRREKDTVSAGLDPEGLTVRLDPEVPLRVTLSADRKILNVLPLQPLDPGRAYALSVSGRYCRPGLQFMSHIWLTRGERLGDFSARVRFKAESPAETAAAPGPLLLKHLSFHTPSIFTTFGQIGIDDLCFVVVPIRISSKNRWAGWAMLAPPADDAKPSVLPGNRGAFPVEVEHYAGRTLITADRLALDQGGDSATLSLLRICAKPHVAANASGLRANSLYAEGESFSMTGVLYDVPLRSTPLVGTVDVHPVKAPGAAPAGISVRSVKASDGKIVVEYDNTAGLKAEEHHFSVALVLSGSGKPVYLDYPKATRHLAGPSGRIRSTELRLPAALPPGARKGVIVIVVIDGAVAYESATSLSPGTGVDAR